MRPGPGRAFRSRLVGDPGLAAGGLVRPRRLVHTASVEQGGTHLARHQEVLPAQRGRLASRLRTVSSAAAAGAGAALAPLGIVLLSLGPSRGKGGEAWLLLAILSLILQGIGAFIAKLVVTPAGPSALLLMGAAVQVAVGLYLAPPRAWSRGDLSGRPAALTIIAYAIAGIATIGYLLALASGRAAIVVPLVATSPALAGLLGVAILKEKTNRRQLSGIALALAGVVLLSVSG